MKSFFLAVWEVLEVVVVAVVTVFLIRSFLIQPFLVSGASMEPTFGTGNYLIIDEITYRLREPKRGEVIVFKYPDNPSTYYIKRIVGLPGEKVEIKKGSVYIADNENLNGMLLEEEYLPVGLKTSGNLSTALSGEEYFVLGDNRNYSYDSRSWGTLPKKYIIGIARLRLLPITKVQAFAY
ncbi:MAG: signal peptidase I [Candidatus Harrisonbacteria bacterium]|nr:signal peptidase I [Candidatus Harrisonbacteria bacterium]